MDPCFSLALPWDKQPPISRLVQRKMAKSSRENVFLRRSNLTYAKLRKIDVREIFNKSYPIVILAKEEILGAGLPAIKQPRQQIIASFTHCFLHDVPVSYSYSSVF